MCCVRVSIYVGRSNCQCIYKLSTWWSSGYNVTKLWLNIIFHHVVEIKITLHNLDLHITLLHITTYYILLHITTYYFTYSPG